MFSILQDSLISNKLRNWYELPYQHVPCMVHKGLKRFYLGLLVDFLWKAKTSPNPDALRRASDLYILWRKLAG